MRRGILRSTFVYQRNDANRSSCHRTEQKPLVTNSTVASGMTRIEGKGSGFIVHVIQNEYEFIELAAIDSMSRGGSLE